ncbi:MULTISPECIES: 2Fe-2S iron-sulfur cluster binding domain-containing protein [Nocardiopsis]|uniref:2Fe-2S iron-sulfur cluster binding domain-containing protein n=1 Tax=Nocardiopsis TaxID=2013 RepID=UPI0019816E95|nr:MULTISPECIES: 2Fe-2S iron-sulfur cluster binding domain-containing protein [Nocardiopsis]
MPLRPRGALSGRTPACGPRTGPSSSPGPPLRAAEKAGVTAPSSCEEGTCGTCETRIVAGTADHRGSVLTEEERRERGTVMICVSRAERGCAELTPGR